MMLKKLIEEIENSDIKELETFLNKNSVSNEDLTKAIERVEQLEKIQFKKEWGTYKFKDYFEIKEVLEDNIYF